MATQAFRLDMKSPLHVGEMGVGQEETLAYIPSDTLFGALVMTWLELGRPALVDELSTWAENGPALLLTSAFPYLGETLLYPRPRLVILPAGGGKAYKRVQWVSQTIFDSLVSKPTQANLDAQWRNRAPQSDTAIWVAPEDNLATAHSWGPQRVPKVTIDRVSNASTLFHVGRVSFSDDAGLWFSAEGEEEWLDAVAEALYLLADSGIGGQRSRGNGRFEPTKLTAVAPPAGGGTTYQVLLSRLAPTEGQMDHLRRPSSSYQLVTIGGWASTPGDHPLIRKRVRMLAEGSIVMAGQIGQLVDVNPNSQLVHHPIYRYGYGYGVPVNLPKDWSDDAPSGGVQ